MINQQTTTNYAFLVTASLMWGGTFALLTVASESFNPMALAWWRVVLGAFVLYVYLKIKGHKLPTDPTIWGKFAVLGITICALPFVVVNYAIQYTNSSTVGLAMAMIPIFSTLLGTLAGQVKNISWQHYLGIAIGFFGIYMLVTGDGQGLDFNNKLGALLGVTGALCYSGSMIINKHLQGIVHTYVQTLLPFVWGSVFLLPIAYLTGYGIMPTGTPTLWSVVGLLAAAVFPTVIARILATIVLLRTNPAFASISGYLVPISSAAIGAFLMGEVLTSHFWIAFSCILGSIWLCKNRPQNTPNL